VDQARLRDLVPSHLVAPRKPIAKDSDEYNNSSRLSVNSQRSRKAKNKLRKYAEEMSAMN